MARWKNLSRFQQFLLILQAIFLVVCSVLYPIFARMEGISYRDSFLRYRAEGENAVYSGKVDGVPVTFTASPDKTLVFQSGDSIPVTYTVTEDPSAVPKDHDMSDVLTGVEVRRDGEILFRGGWYTGSGFDLLVDEDGNQIAPTITISYGGDERQYRADGQPITPSSEPDAAWVLTLTSSPALVHRGDGMAYLGGTFLVALNAVAILFADELFHFDLRFQIRHPERAEPSDWELFTRHAGWVVLTVAAILVYIVGLTVLT